MTMNRRQMLKACAQTGTVAAFGPTITACSNSKAKKIDVHHHAIPTLYLDALASIGLESSGGIAFPTWTPQHSLNVMDFNGIDCCVLSVSSPGTYFGHAGFAINLAREVNEYLASVVATHPTRFGFFASLPTPLVEASSIEAEYALNTLNAEGVCLLASSGSVFLGDPSQDSLLSVLNNYNATVFIHPNLHPSTEQLGLSVPEFAVEFVVDTTRAISNMVWNGTFEKFPNINWIVSHAGGTIPFIAWRLSLLDLKFPELKERSPQGSLAYLKRLYYDTALSPTANSLFPILNQFGIDQLVLGTDYPFAPAPLVPLELIELNRATPAIPDFNSAGLGQILDNGFKLFPRLHDLHFASVQA